MGAMRHQKSVGIEVEPLYCKVYAPLPHGTSRLSRFRFGQSVPTPFLCGQESNEGMRWLQWQRTLAYRASGQEEQSATELLDEDIFPSDRLAPSLVPSDHAMGCPTRGNASETHQQHRLQRQLPRGECMSMMTGRYGLENRENE